MILINKTDKTNKTNYHNSKTDKFDKTNYHNSKTDKTNTNIEKFNNNISDIDDIADISIDINKNNIVIFTIMIIGFISALISIFYLYLIFINKNKNNNIDID